MSFKSKISVVLFLGLFLASSSHACLKMEAEYCCGPSLGVIQDCTERVTVKQTPVDGGAKFEFSSRDLINGEYLADGKKRMLELGDISGEGTVTCTDTGVVLNIPDATLKKDGIVARGYYSSGLSTYDFKDGSFNFFHDCAFNESDGTPVGTTCAGGNGGLVYISCSPKSLVHPGPVNGILPRAGF
jgi:hypothetical protein